jgi:NDP-sugar pyrophosphorylase family protein
MNLYDCLDAGMAWHMDGNQPGVCTAFVLGAGLGTRLRPLTVEWPKPLLKAGGRPVIAYAFDRLAELGVARIIVNTHHLAHRYEEVFPDRRWRDVELVFRYEAELLETGGGIKNIEDLVVGESLLIYNGDIVSTLPLRRLLDGHRQAGNEATLALRSSGGPLHIALAEDGRLADIGEALGAAPGPRFLFSGIYVIERPFFARLTAGKKESVIPTFLAMIRAGDRIGGVVIDEGEWSDIGALSELQRVDQLLSAASSGS